MPAAPQVSPAILCITNSRFLIRYATSIAKGTKVNDRSSVMPKYLYSFTQAIGAPPMVSSWVTLVQNIYIALDFV